MKMAKIFVSLDMNDTLNGPNRTSAGTIMHDIIDSIDTIADITGCRMIWGTPKPNVVGWEFSFRDEIQEECTLSMLNDLVRDFPQNLSLEVVG
jgi:hypothetical protein